MTTKVSVFRRWTGPVPTDKGGNAIPKCLWPQRRAHVWIVRWFTSARNGRTPRMQRTFTSKAAAEAFQAEKRNELEKHPSRRTKRDPISLRAFIDEFVILRQGAKGMRLKASTVLATKHALDLLADHVGRDAMLSTIDGVVVLRFLAALSDRMSTSSVNKHKRQLKAAFSMAVKRLKYLTENPFSEVRCDRVEKTRPRYVTRSEFRALLAACNHTAAERALWWRAFLLIAYTAGLRYQEIVHLTWTDVDFAGEFVTVASKAAGPQLLPWTPKSYETRTIPIPRETTAELLKMHAGAADGHPYVFIPPGRLELIQSLIAARMWREEMAVLNNVRRDFTEIVLRAAVDAPTLVRMNTKGHPTATISIHDLRRSAITHWTKSVTIQTVKELAGHSAIETTMAYYAAVTPDQMDLARASAMLSSPETDARLTQGGVSEGEKRISELGRAGVEPATHGFSVRCSTN